MNNTIKKAFNIVALTMGCASCVLLLFLFIIMWITGKVVYIGEFNLAIRAFETVLLAVSSIGLFKLAVARMNNES